MMLTVDIGNTQTVVGLYTSDDAPSAIDAASLTPSVMWRIATHKTDTADDIRARVLPLLHAAGAQTSAINRAAYASVVPALTQAWHQALGDIAPMEVRFCTAEIAHNLGLFDTTYARPNEIGPDRVADAIAARALFGSPCIVVDFGTATDIDVIDAQGRFCGGIIAPGLQTSASALFANATRLGAIDLVAPECVIGRSTEEAIQSGIVLGEAERVDGLVRRVFDQLGCTAPVVATGGFSPLVSTHSHAIQHVLPELTLEGLRLLAQASHTSRF